MSRLPPRRQSVTFELAADQLGQHLAVASVGFYEDGSPGEIFLNAVKRDQLIDHLIRDTGILLSYCLQSGCDFSRLREGVTRDAFGAPQGIAGAVLDALAESLPPRTPDDNGPAPVAPAPPCPIAGGGAEAVHVAQV